METTVNTQNKEIHALTAALAASTIALKASETRNSQHLQQELTKLQKQVTNQTTSSASQVRTELMNELKKVKQQLPPPSK